MKRRRNTRSRKAAHEDEYTTIGRGGDWYGHPGPPAREERNIIRRRSARSERERPPFEDERHNSRAGDSDWHEQDRDTADYAYGGYGQREPGHARSEPYPPQSNSSVRPGEPASGS
jgi:hypothetical protein